MAADVPSPVSVPLPRTVDRSLRLGPFPSARDALKFAGYAAAGLVAVPIAGPAAIVPFAAAGFVVATHRRDGRAFDDRVLGYLAYRWRRRRPGSVGPRLRRAEPGGFAPLPGRRIGAVVRAAGVPVAFLPPEEARGLFDGAQRWLHDLGGSAYVIVETVPLAAARFVSRAREAAGDGSADDPARRAYRDLVALLLQRRRTRQVLVVLWEPADAGGARRLDGRVGATLGALAALGVPAERLRGRALERDVRRIGLAGAARR